MRFMCFYFVIHLFTLLWILGIRNASIMNCDKWKVLSFRKKIEKPLNMGNVRV